MWKTYYNRRENYPRSHMYVYIYIIHTLSQLLGLQVPNICWPLTHVFSRTSRAASKFAWLLNCGTAGSGFWKITKAVNQQTWWFHREGDRERERERERQRETERDRERQREREREREKYIYIRTWWSLQCFHSLLAKWFTSVAWRLDSKVTFKVPIDHRSK